MFSDKKKNKYIKIEVIFLYKWCCHYVFSNNKAQECCTCMVLLEI